MLGLILYSNQGFQYISYQYKAVCNSNNIQISMLRTPSDDSILESFHRILKKELCITIISYLYNTSRLKSNRH